MKPDQEILEKLAKKRHHKMRGVLRSFEWVNQSIAKVMLTKGQGSEKKFFQFTAFGQNAEAISKFKVGYRMKVWFSIKCNQHKETWYTNLIIESFEHWAVAEDKVKKAQRIKELEESQVRMEFTQKSTKF